MLDLKHSLLGEKGQQQMKFIEVLFMYIKIDAQTFYKNTYLGIYLLFQLPIHNIPIQNISGLKQTTMYYFPRFSASEILSGLGQVDHVVLAKVIHLDAFSC